MLAIHAACMHNLLMRERESCVVCIITHCCLLSLVQYAKCPASPHSVWEPVMSGTVTARDIWLLADVPLFLSFQEPPWCGSPVSRDVLMCTNRDALYNVNLCPTFVHSVNMMRCQAEAGAGKGKRSHKACAHVALRKKKEKRKRSNYLCASLPRSRTRPRRLSARLKHRRIS